MKELQLEINTIPKAHLNLYLRFKRLPKQLLMLLAKFNPSKNQQKEKEVAPVFLENPCQMTERK
jgi:hypothetical protein